MKVVQLVPRMEVGGVERGTVEMVRALVAAGHSAYVVSSGGRLVEEVTKAGGTHIARPIGSKNPWVAAACIPKLRALVRNEGIDIVHARSRVPAWVGYYAVRGTRAHFITTAHGFYRPHWLSRSMVMGEKVIAVSWPVKQHLMEKFGVAESKIVVIHRGVDMREFYEQPAEAVAAFKEKWRVPVGVVVAGLVGRPSATKGHAVFLASVRRLMDSGHPIQGLVVGVGPGSELAVRHPRVTFIPPTKEVPVAYSAMDICVVPSVSPEAFGRTIIEAMACRRPVIASALGGVLDIIQDGVNGLLFPAGDADALADCILKLYNDPALRARLAEAGLETVRTKFTVEKYTSETIQLYRQVLAT